MLRILHHRDNTALFTVLVTATTSGRRRVQTLVLLIKETRKMLLSYYKDLGVAGKYKM